MDRNRKIVLTNHSEMRARAWRDLAETVDGRAAIAALINELGVFSVPAPDAMYSPYRDGMRQAGLMVMALAFQDPGHHAAMILEEAARALELKVAVQADEKAANGGGDEMEDSEDIYG